jgi:Domain of unknown function (DUF6471)
VKNVDKDYQAKAKGLLRAEIARRNLSYEELAEMLAAIGVDDTSRNLSNKISRGGFSAGFFLQCLEAIGVQDLRLE